MMVELLVANPLLTLFLIAAIGAAIGQIKVGGVSLGIAAVLFVGLFFGALTIGAQEDHDGGASGR